ncbi:MAG TPA: hypothetical protein VIJ76_05820 [Galbitalea sp.]
MQWWNDLVSWFNSSAGWRVFSTAILPFIAIIVAALLAAWIGRASARRVLAYHDRELKGAAITSLIGAGRKAAIWSSLGGDEKQHVDMLISDADIRVRLLPVNGAGPAADWAAHELAAMKKNSATFSFQAEQTFIDYRDRLLEWQDKPKRARKLFAFDLDQWRYEDTSSTSTAQPAASESSAPSTSEAGAAAPLDRQPPDWSSVPAPAATTPAPLAETVAIPLPAAAPVSSDATPASTGSVEIPETATQHADEDAEVVDDPAGSFASPITAGAVRRRIGTEPSDEDR